MVAGPVASQPFSGVAVPGVSARLLARPPSRTRRAAAPARAASARGGLARRLDQEPRTIISPPLARAAQPALDATARPYDDGAPNHPVGPFAPRRSRPKCRPTSERRRLGN